jgi:hypothetical protein
VRPSVTEQLNGLRRILDEVVAPELQDPYPADILAGVCATLETLAAGWARVPAFLIWDAEATTALLADLPEMAATELGPRLATDIAAHLESPIPDASDVPAVEAHHREARALLERAIPTIAERPELRELYTRVTALMRERSQRYPLTTVWRPAVAAPLR